MLNENAFPLIGVVTCEDGKDSLVTITRTFVDVQRKPSISYRIESVILKRFATSKPHLVGGRCSIQVQMVK